jgi:hypothetical protein
VKAVAAIESCNPCAAPGGVPRCRMARFTSANARDMAARSRESRRMRAATRAQAGFQAHLRLALSLGPADYVTSEIARTRAQIEKVHQLIEKTDDAMGMLRLARALARLGERERILSGRPRP